MVLFCLLFISDFCVSFFLQIFTEKLFQMTTSTENIESEVTNGTINDDNITFDSNQISSDEQLSQIIDSINLSTTCEDSSVDESQSKSSTNAVRTPGQTAIGAKLVKKLETLGTIITLVKDLFIKIFFIFSCNIKRKQANQW